jgi:hypothetical protein
LEERILRLNLFLRRSSQAFGRLNQRSTTAAFPSTFRTALRTAEICRQAIACVFPSGLPATTEEICSKAEEMSDETLDELEALDTEFMQYPHNLTDLLFAFVSGNPQEFGPLPEAE